MPTVLSLARKSIKVRAEIIALRRRAREELYRNVEARCQEGIMVELIIRTRAWTVVERRATVCLRLAQHKFNIIFHIISRREETLPRKHAFILLNALCVELIARDIR